MQKNIKNFYLFLTMCIWLTGCVGPTSPFGALELGTGDGEEFKAQSTVLAPVGQMNFRPKRQVLHQAESLNVVINNDDKPINLDEVQVRVSYNDRDVTYAFKKYLRVTNTDENQVVLAYENLRLLPTKTHRIKILYSADNGATFLEANYLPPMCKLSQDVAIQSTEPFLATDDLLKLISENAKKYELNPNLLAGLVAQESGFNITATSRANAKGLTQITTIAAEEIERLNPKFEAKKWSRGTEEDWRNIPAASIEGGAIYLKYLLKYWDDEESKALMATNGIKELAPVILASYNSGAARVKNSIASNGKKWLEQRKLKEAFRYVNNVTSYCYHFAGGVE